MIDTLNINKVKELMEEIKNLSKQGDYREFEIALLISEQSNLKHNDITQSLVDKVDEVAYSADTLFSDYLNDEMDDILYSFEKFNVPTRKISSLNELRNFIEELGWNIDDDGSCWEIQKYSPAGEDFFFDINHNGDLSRAIEEIQDYCKNGFDAEEHVTMFLEAKQNGFQGVPSASDLVRDANDIQDMLNDLDEFLTNHIEIVKEEPDIDILENR